MRPRHLGRPIATMLGLALSLSVLTPAATRAATGITLGSPAPDFTKTQLAGGPVSLSDYRGKVVLLFLLGYS